MSNVVCIYHGSLTILFLATKYMKCQQIYASAFCQKSNIISLLGDILFTKLCRPHSHD